MKLSFSKFLLAAAPLLAMAPSTVAVISKSCGLDICVAVDMSGSVCTPLDSSFGKNCYFCSDECYDTTFTKNVCCSAFDQQMKFAKDLVDYVEDELPDSRFSLVSFGVEATRHTNGLVEKVDFFAEVDSLDYVGGWTNTGGALERCFNTLDNDSPNKKAIVLITDGTPTTGAPDAAPGYGPVHKSFAEMKANQAKNAGISIFPVLVNTIYSDNSFLETLATDMTRVTTVSSFSELDSGVAAVVNLVDRECDVEENDNGDDDDDDKDSDGDDNDGDDNDNDDDDDNDDGGDGDGDDGDDDGDGNDKNDNDNGDDNDDGEDDDDDDGNDNKDNGETAGGSVDPTTCEDKAVSVCLAIDMSGSVCTPDGQNAQLCNDCPNSCYENDLYDDKGVCCTNFDLTMKYAADTATAVSDAVSSSAYSLVSFATNAQTVSGLVGTNDFVTKVNGLDYTGGWTNTGDAIQSCFDTIKDSNNKKVIVLITDGTPTNGSPGVGTGYKQEHKEWATTRANIAKGNGTILIPVLIGTVSADLGYLETLATNENTVVSVQHFENLEDKLAMLATKVKCEG